MFLFGLSHCLVNLLNLFIFFGKLNFEVVLLLYFSITHSLETFLPSVGFGVGFGVGLGVGLGAGISLGTGNPNIG